MLRLPYPKTNAYFYVTATGVLLALVSSGVRPRRNGVRRRVALASDCRRTFAAVVAAALGAVQRPTIVDLWTYVGAMILLLVIGVVGAVLHLRVLVALLPERASDGPHVRGRFGYCRPRRSR